MVFKFQLQRWNWLAALVLLAFSVNETEASIGQDYLREAKTLYKNGQYFSAARYAFAAAQNDRSLRADSYSWVTVSLIQAGLHHSASYFFIKTLQLRKKSTIRRVLPYTEDLLVRVGGDLLRKYLIRFTDPEDYPLQGRSAYFYSRAKASLLRGKTRQAIHSVSGVSPESSLWPFALQVRATARALGGDEEGALGDFRACIDLAGQSVSRLKRAQIEGSQGWLRSKQAQEEDLRARCQAGVGRVYYQRNDFKNADRAYDQISKTSIVWPDILFEQAWNAFAKREYNRALGKLVTYKSPLLRFVHNSEIEVLRAQSYLALCLYGDASKVVKQYEKKYRGITSRLKKTIERHPNNLRRFYEIGKEARQAKLHSKDPFHQVMNRFVRSPYFQDLLAAEESIEAEKNAIRRFARNLPGASSNPRSGFPGFLRLVLGWRMKTIKLFGGAFVKNNLIDAQRKLISDFEKVSFINLELLRRAKDRLQFGKELQVDRTRGNIEPDRRNDQYRWGFNGEFWNDELGDYVFGLESRCES